MDRLLTVFPSPLNMRKQYYYYFFFGGGGAGRGNCFSLPCFGCIASLSAGVWILLLPYSILLNISSLNQGNREHDKAFFVGVGEEELFPCVWSHSPWFYFMFVSMKFFTTIYQTSSHVKLWTALLTCTMDQSVLQNRRKHFLWGWEMELFTWVVHL